ncbi:MAG: hypothetical protein WBA13_10680 [Microcoleaceae cyanobacterium]
MGDLDISSATSGNDLLFGNLGADFVYGNEGNDSIFGGQDPDIVAGDAGNDLVSGDLGDDVIIGVNIIGLNPGAGEIDTLTGGAGADFFYMGDFSTTYYTASGNRDYAIITDFNPL